MTRIILSFLGTTDYQPTTYDLGGRRHTCTYFQQALQQLFPASTLLVAMTPDARAKHGAALGACCDHRSVEVPVGRSERELWQLFESIAQAVPPEAKLVVDVTYGFRLQPMLALAACAYLAAVKAVQIDAILYAAYEARDDHGVTPVFDLTSFFDLIGWSLATDAFLTYGHAGPLRDILRDAHTTSHTRASSDGEHQPYRATGLATMGTQVAAVMGALAMIRPVEAVQAAQRLPDAVAKSRQDATRMPQVAPLLLLLDHVGERLRPLTAAEGQLFTAAGFEAQAAMIEHYLRTEQFAQAVTLAREAIVSKLAIELRGDPIHDREAAETHLNSWADALRGDGAVPTERRDLADVWHRLRDLRNDINHAGMRPSATPTDKAVAAAKELCRRVQEHLR